MGPSEKDQLEMLKTIGFESLDELVTSTVPANIRLEEPMELGSHTSAAMSETEALSLLRSMADKNKVLKSLIGQGYNETHTPYVILRNMLENPVCLSASRITRHRRRLFVDFGPFRTASGPEAAQIQTRDHPTSL
jgi:glycine dehydrogenase